MTKKTHPDDHIVGYIVSEFLQMNKYYPTLTKLTACFNISVRLIRVCSVCGDKKDLLKLANQFHKELVKEIEDLNSEK